MTEGAIEAMCAAFWGAHWDVDPALSREACMARMRGAAAYEAAIWRPIHEAAKDGTPMIGLRQFDGDYKTNKPSIIEVRWGTDSFGFVGFTDCEGRRWNISHIRSLPKPEEIVKTREDHP